MSSSKAASVEDSMWKGSRLPDDVGCDCSFGRPHHTDVYEANAILKYAREFPAGSSRFFQTDFQQAFEIAQVGGIQPTFNFA